MITLVECKFSAGLVGAKVMKEIDAKIKALSLPRKYTVEKVLITANEVTSDLEESDYFNQIISIDQFYKPLS